MSSRPTVGWVVSGDRNVASSRLQALNIHDYLVSRGYSSEVACIKFHERHRQYSLDFAALARRMLKRQYDVVILERPNWMMYKLSTLLRAAGTRTIGVCCDPPAGYYNSHFNLTILPTEDLARFLGIRVYTIIDDMIEVPAGVYKKSYELSGTRMRIVWVGHPSYRPFISTFASQLENLEWLKDRIEFVTISAGEWATHQWALNTVFDQICSCDVAVIPLPNWGDWWVKSSNRLAMFMACGMPTVATPINSYLAAGEDGTTCLFADSVEAFGEAISRLESPRLREQIGSRALEFARARWAPLVIGEKWIDAIETVAHTRNGPAIGAPYKLLSSLLGTF